MTSKTEQVLTELLVKVMLASIWVSPAWAIAFWWHIKVIDRNKAHEWMRAAVDRGWA